MHFVPQTCFPDSVPERPGNWKHFLAYALHCFSDCPASEIHLIIELLGSPASIFQYSCTVIGKRFQNLGGLYQ